MPLDSWAAATGFSKPWRTTTLNAVHYEMRRHEDRLRVNLGDNIASWNGLEIWLGFPPKIIDGKPCLNRLDIEKNLDPLISGVSEPARPHPVIVVDAGHGGPQVGTHSLLPQRFEKEFALDWALRLERLLSSNGWTVFLTRTNDSDVAISNRVALAEKVKADLFLSLHFNSSYPQTDQAGVETYCLTPEGMPSSLTRGFEDAVDHTLPNNAFDAANLRYAWKIHRGILAATHGKDRGIRRARFMGVLRAQSRAAVLIEGGYLSNPREARLIALPEYRQQLAVGIANALRLDGNATNAPSLHAQANP